MGGAMKGAHGSCRRKWSSSYAVMAVVCCVLGCGIVGLVGIQRLRERASFNLLIKERDDRIVSLHLLLQRERELAAEAGRKAAEARRGLGSQRAEMESTISSLREERRAAESALRERANLMKEKCDRVEALGEELRRREGEIEELKARLQLGSSNETVVGGDGGEVEATGEKGHEHEKAGDGRLRRAKGRRWRLIGNRMQGKRNESAVREAEKSPETKVEEREGGEAGEAIGLEKPTEETDVSGRKGVGEEENEDQGEESEETNEAEV